MYVRMRMLIAVVVRKYKIGWDPKRINNPPCTVYTMLMVHMQAYSTWTMVLHSPNARWIGDACMWRYLTAIFHIVNVSKESSKHTFGLKLSLNVCSCFRGPSLGSNSFKSSSVRDTRMPPDIPCLFIASAASSPTSPLTFWYSSSTFSSSSWMAIPMYYVCLLLCSSATCSTICSTIYWLTDCRNANFLFIYTTYCCAGSIIWLHSFVGEQWSHISLDPMPPICCLPLTQIPCRQRRYSTICCVVC